MRGRQRPAAKHPERRSGSRQVPRDLVRQVAEPDDQELDEPSPKREEREGQERSFEALHPPRARMLGTKERDQDCARQGGQQLAHRKREPEEARPPERFPRQNPVGGGERHGGREERQTHGAGAPQPTRPRDPERKRCPDQEVEHPADEKEGRRQIGRPRRRQRQGAPVGPRIKRAQRKGERHRESHEEGGGQGGCLGLGADRRQPLLAHQMADHQQSQAAGRETGREDEDEEPSLDRGARTSQAPIRAMPRPADQSQTGRGRAVMGPAAPARGSAVRLQGLVRAIVHRSSEESLGIGGHPAGAVGDDGDDELRRGGAQALLEIGGRTRKPAAHHDAIARSARPMAGGAERRESFPTASHEIEGRGGAWRRQCGRMGARAARHRSRRNRNVRAHHDAGRTHVPRILRAGIAAREERGNEAQADERGALHSGTSRTACGSNRFRNAAHRSGSNMGSRLEIRRKKRSSEARSKPGTANTGW